MLNINFEHKILMAEHQQGITVLGLSNDKLAIFDLNSIQNFNNQKWQHYIESPLQS
jgi:hypothetical protein